MSGTVFFGERWDAPIVDHAEQGPTPVGKPCYDCGEAVEEGDRGFIRACMRMGGAAPTYTIEPIHAECDLRNVMGHQLGLCPCHGYEHNRATARLVWQRVGEQRGRSLEQTP